MADVTYNWYEENIKRLREELEQAHGIIRGMEDALAGRVRTLADIGAELTLATLKEQLADLEAEMRRFAHNFPGTTAAIRQALAWAEKLKALHG